MKTRLNLFWFRRDLRLIDNNGLYKALQSGLPVLPIFIFDTDILEKLENKEDKRVDFIFQALEKLNEYLEKQGKSIQIFFGKPIEIYENLSQQYDIESVFCNEDYEPYAIKRDQEVKDFLASKNINFHQFKDQVIFQKDEIVKADGKPYTVYTPYSRQWLLKFQEKPLEIFPSEKKIENLFEIKAQNFTLESIGFKKTNYQFEPPKINLEILEKYHETRNLPTKETSQMSVHLRFGTISTRKLVKLASELHDNTYLKELIWREFFMQILWHFPKVVHHSFKEKYDNIDWENNEVMFQKWCEGKTGYPIVDAGMRELNETGLMHNRVRMVCASFLTKHLLADWRLGEAYFAEKLMDYDLSANNGNWQWSAGSGCDAAPYFRVFNPEEQQKKFDPDFIYIKKWVKEFGTSRYPKPIIEHKFARERALERYKKGLGD
ncbi:deoxyribodipyrimidine photo-lyase [Cloacibacterium rupense]|uniref:Deoxyribodipyrimidine photo-lyase n=1 Tax=Cloacibacterium rupense TaxID=517423 RepID=A0ABQ2NE85_9FLAO|nr:deoxyribodipyrimidine photo-lyase [Cloacibacterium rupense]GGP01072.1 deoxyribodipyrimidine photo-lyase [Cloacibacterium rupense]